MAHIHVYAEFVLLENFAESDFSFIIIVLLKKTIHLLFGRILRHVYTWHNESHHLLLNFKQKFDVGFSFIVYKKFKHSQ